MAQFSASEDMERLLQLTYDPSVDPREFPRYTTAEVAQFLNIAESTLRTWIRGRHYRTKYGMGFFRPLITPADEQSSPPLLSFYNLAEAHIIKSVRQHHRVKMRAIRNAIDYVSSLLPSPHPHPLLTENFFTEGRYLFLRRIEELVNASQFGQLGLGAILEQYLQRILRGPDGLPVEIYPVIPGRPDRKSISIRYRVCSGSPVVAGTGVPVTVIQGRYHAGESVEELADDFSISPDLIEDALAYELAAA